MDSIAPAHHSSITCKYCNHQMVCTRYQPPHNITYFCEACWGVLLQGKEPADDVWKGPLLPESAWHRDDVLAP